MGIYVHIPFCKQACHYCNFHFNVNLNNISKVIDGINKEIKLRKNFFSEKVDTIYFGGGTPSLLSPKQISTILQTIDNNNLLNNNLEVTIEINPRDVDLNKLRDYKNIGINRLSIGVQSFNNNILKYLNRDHNGSQAIHSIEIARKAGFENINLDLIYSIPESSLEILKDDLNIISKLVPEHIAAYNLTIEQNTLFGYLSRKNRLQTLHENAQLDHYNLVREHLSNLKYQQYEISNFCKQKKYSKHNINYWKKGCYLGLGPSAHSYDKKYRYWNISNNIKYCKLLSQSIIPCNKELLSFKNHINEFLMTSFRTKWGLDLSIMKKNYNYTFNKNSLEYIHSLQKASYLVIKENKIILTQKGFLISDKISSDLFV